MRLRLSVWAALVVAAPFASGSASAAPKVEKPANDQSRLQRAAQAITESDSDRILRDAAYAAEMFGHIEIVQQSAELTAQEKLALDALQMIALMGAGRDKDAFEVAVDLNRRAPGTLEYHYMAFLIGTFVDQARALEELERADRLLKSDDDRSEFREGISLEAVQALRASFGRNKDKERLRRSAQALLNFGWPGDEQISMADRLRLDVVEARLDKRDIEGARAVAAAIRSPSSMVPMLVTRKYDAVTGPTDPLAQMAEAVAAFDKATSQLLAAKPNDARALIERAQFLRSVGQESEALALVQPKIQDMAAVKETGEDGFWLVNEAAYSLLALNRPDEAVGLMRQLLGLGLEEHPELISMAINTGAILIGAGRYREGAEHSTKLFAEHKDFASPYGQMWMWGTAACGYLLAGDSAAAKPWLERLEKGRDDNPAALTRAYLCADDIESAAAVVVMRLNGDEPEDMLVALQDYTIGPKGSPTHQLLERRWAHLVERPEVQGAIAARGRRMQLPLSRIYWGNF